MGSLRWVLHPQQAKRKKERDRERKEGREGRREGGRKEKKRKRNNLLPLLKSSFSDRVEF